MSHQYHFWNQIQKQEKKPSLQQLYFKIVENQNVALYSKEIGDSSDLPPAPEGTEGLMVVPRDYLGKIKSLAVLQSEKNKNILPDLFSKKAGITAKYHKVLVPVIKAAVEASGYEHAAELLNQTMIHNGFFDANKKGEYNAIAEAIDGISKVAPELQDKGMEAFLLNLLTDTTKFARTAVGAGELFYCLFSNAKVSQSEEGSKSGDLMVDDNQIEVKSSGGRMGSGPSNNANHANQNISKYLKSKRLKPEETEFFDDEKNQLSQELSNLVGQQGTVHDFLVRGRELLNNKEAHSFVNKQFEREIFKKTEALLASNPHLSWQTPMASTQVWKPATTGKPFNFLILSKLKEMENAVLSRRGAKSAFEDEVPAAQSNLAYLLKNTFQLLKKLNKPESEAGFPSFAESTNKPTKEELINIIAFTSNYSEKECEEFDYSIRADIETYLSGATEDAILDLSTGALVNLVGGIHLTCYANAKRFDTLMLLDKTKGNVICFDAPMTLRDGIAICRRSDIVVDPNIDVKEGTIIATSCQYTYKS